MRSAAVLFGCRLSSAPRNNLSILILLQNSLVHQKRHQQSHAADRMICLQGKRQLIQSSQIVCCSDSSVERFKGGSLDFGLHDRADSRTKTNLHRTHVSPTPRQGSLHRPLLTRFHCLTWSLSKNIACTPSSSAIKSLSTSSDLQFSHF